MIIQNNKAENIKISYIGGGSRGWAWGLMSDLVSSPDISGEVRLYSRSGKKMGLWTYNCCLPQI